VGWIFALTHHCLFDYYQNSDCVQGQTKLKAGKRKHYYTWTIVGRKAPYTCDRVYFTYNLSLFYFRFVFTLLYVTISPFSEPCVCLRYWVSLHFPIIFTCSYFYHYINSQHYMYGKKKLTCQILISFLLIFSRTLTPHNKN